MLRGIVPFGGMPWGRLAFGLVDTPLVRYGRVGGTALVAFVVVAGRRAGRRRRSSVATAVAGCAVGVVVAASRWRSVSLVLPVGAADPIGTLQVAAVQGNVPGEGMRRVRRAPCRARQPRRRRRSDFAAQVAAGERPRARLRHLARELDRHRPVLRPSRPTTRSTPRCSADRGADPGRRRRRRSGADHVQNMGIVWDPVTGPGEQYVKRHPVPFGEYIPFREHPGQVHQATRPDPARLRTAAPSRRRARPRPVRRSAT